MSVIIAKSLSSRIILIAGILGLFPTFALAQLPQSIDEVEALTPAQLHQTLADAPKYSAFLLYYPTARNIRIFQQLS